jgi:glycosyltransferase involved in cell wall biosynthesis
LDRVIAQSFTDWECILVDDGSKDSSPKICVEYAERDNRFLVLHKENGGPSKARNAGLEVARGEWISFIDADDWVDEGFFDEIFVYPNADIIYFGFKQIEANQIIENQITEQSYSNFENIGQEYARLFTSKVEYFGYTWDKFFKRGVIEQNNIRFPDNLVHREDEVFSFRYSHYVKCMVISSKTAYNYRINPASVTHIDSFFYDFCKLADYMEAEIGLVSHSEFKLPILKRILRYRIGSLHEDKGQSKFDESYTKYIKFCRKYSKALNFNLKQQIKIWLPIAISKRIDKTRI